jgi:hypothetical protein
MGAFLEMQGGYAACCLSKAAFHAVPRIFVGD